MLKESAMEKWFKFEMARVNSGVVIKKRALADLVNEEKPKAVAKDGDPYYFDRGILQKLQSELPSSLHSLKLPISIYSSLEVRGSVHIADSISLSVLKQLGEIPKDAHLKDGGYWMGKPLASDIMKRYPTMFQLVRY